MASILVIDDDGLAAELYISLLRAFGYEATFVTTGDEAIRHLATARPDLVILDIMMPEVNGLDLLRKLKSDEQTSGLRIVIFSALDEISWREGAAEAGAYDYWIKGGFDFGELQERVATCLTGADRSHIGENCTHGGRIDDAHKNRSKASGNRAASNPGATITSWVRDYPGMKTIIAEYVQALPGEISKMMDLLNREEMQPLRRVAHQLRGTGGGYGFEQVSDLAGEVEDAINAGDQHASVALKVNLLIDMIRCIEGFDEHAGMLAGKGGAL